jgi:two-component system OmpR family response regulator
MGTTLGKIDSENTTQMKLSVAVIANDKSFLNDLAGYLSIHEFVVDTFMLGHEAQMVNAIEPFDVVIIELTTSDQNMLAVVRQLSSAQISPGILMLSSYADEVDRVVALELGADDVVTKSTSLREILARVRAISRRYNAMKSMSKALIASEVKDFDKSYRGWHLDLSESNITAPNGDVILLSRAELQILAALFKKPRTPFSRSELSSIICAGDRPNNSRHVDTLIARLRRKLSIGGYESFIMTASGVGYYCM